MSKVYLRLEELKEYPPANSPSSLVGVSKYSIEELINVIRKFECKCNYIKLLNGIDGIPTEKNDKFWYDMEFVHKYISQVSDLFEIWVPTEEAPLLVNHLKQDLRILIAPKIRGK